MQVQTKDIEKGQIEIVVELSAEEFKPFGAKGAVKLSEELKIEGFRPGKAPYDIVKQKVGEITIYEEGARMAINKTIDEVFRNHVDKTPIGRPEISITKLAPGNPLEYKIVVAVLPEVKLGAYKELGIRKEKSEIKDEEIVKMAGELREMRAKEAAVDRPVGEGDKVVVDLFMFLDNVPLEGGQGKDVAVIIGKSNFIPGLDKQLAGAAKGDTREFKLPFPKDHHQTDIAGKLVEFRAVIKDIFERQVPAMDDDFAKGLGYKSQADLTDVFKKSLLHEKEHEIEHKVERELLEKITDNAKYGDIPDLLIHEEAEKMIGELKSEIERQKGKWEDYLSSLKKNEKELELDMMPGAVKRVKVALAIREIARTEKIEVSEKQIDDEVEALAARYKGYEKVVAHVKSRDYRPVVHNILMNRRVIERLMDWNVI